MSQLNFIFQLGLAWPLPPVIETLSQNMQFFFFGGFPKHVVLENQIFYGIFSYFKPLFHKLLDLHMILTQHLQLITKLGIYQFNTHIYLEQINTYNLISKIHF